MLQWLSYWLHLSSPIPSDILIRNRTGKFPMETTATMSRMTAIRTFLSAIFQRVLPVRARGSHQQDRSSRILSKSDNGGISNKTNNRTNTGRNRNKGLSGSEENPWKKRLIQPADSRNIKKAIKLYFFLKHKPHDMLEGELPGRFTQASHVVFSLFRAFTREGDLKPEYLNFLNDELNSWCRMEDKHWKILDIRPHDVDEIELADRVPVKFYDEENGETLELCYLPQDDVLQYRYI